MERPRKTLVATIKANSLVNLYKKEKERMFAYNIRSFLGRKGINKEIIQTATQHPEDFFYFNNGVSAICTHFEFDEDTQTLVADNFQVINGAQTIGALKQAQDLSSEVEVLIRVIEGSSVKSEKGFNADVIKYNNTQNVVKSSDFRANDSIQVWLEKQFRDMKPRGAVHRKIEYVRKRTFRRPHHVDVVRLEDLAKLRFTWIDEPTRATADPKSLWAFKADGGMYEVAFGLDGDIVDAWPQHDFDEAVLAILGYRYIEERIAEWIKPDRKRIWLKRLRFLALRLLKEYCQEKGLSAADLIATRDLFQKTMTAFWPEAFRALVHAHTQAIEVDKISVFALARSEARWRTMLISFKHVISV
jgi:hypothetical protein